MSKSGQKTLRYEIASLEHHSDGILDLLLNNFCKYEPCLQSLGATPELSKGHMIKTVHDCLSEPVSFVCLDENDRVIGCRLNLIENRQNDCIKDKAPMKQHAITREMGLMYGFLDSLNVNLFDLFPDCSKVLVFRILTVEKSFQGRGIARKLSELALRHGAEVGCDYVRSTATALATQTLFEHMGFQTLKIVRHEDYLDENGRRVFNTQDGSTCGKFVCKRLKE